MRRDPTKGFFFLNIPKLKYSYPPRSAPLLARIRVYKQKEGDGSKEHIRSRHHQSTLAPDIVRSNTFLASRLNWFRLPNETRFRLVDPSLHTIGEYRSEAVIVSCIH